MKKTRFSFCFEDKINNWAMKLKKIEQYRLKDNVLMVLEDKMDNWPTKSKSN